MKRIVFLAGAVALLVVLSGCVTAGSGAGESRPSVPAYPALTRSFDTSARFSVYGAAGWQRNALVAALQRAGYADAGVPNVAAAFAVPDRIVDIVAANYTDAGGWLTCKLTARVRKPMKTPPGGLPAADVGQTFDVWAQDRVAEEGEYVVENGVYHYVHPKLQKSLFAKACANLLNVEGFRLAMELK